MWHVRPFCPMRASSWKKRRMRLFLCVCCIFLNSAGALFKSRLGGRVFLRMARARLLSREPETLQQPSERPGMHPLAEALLADIGQVLERVGRTTAGLWIGPIQHDAHQLGLLLRVERGRPTIAPAVGEAVDPMLVVAQHPVAQRLPVHACRPGCLLPAHAVESVGDRQDAARHTRVRPRPWPACEELSACGPCESPAQPRCAPSNHRGKGITNCGPTEPLRGNTSRSISWPV